MPCSIGVSRRSGELELMTVKIDGSRSSVASSTPRAIRTISSASRFRWRPSDVGVDRLVRERQQRRGSRAGGGRRVDVDRLDRIAGEEVDDVEHLEQADQVLVVGAVADPPAAIEVGDVGRAGDRPERDPVAADREVVRRVRRVERELRRARSGSAPRPCRGRTGRAGVPASTRRAGRRAGGRAAPASRKSMPISSSTRSDATWIDSSSSAETTSVGR